MIDKQADRLRINIGNWWERQYQLGIVPPQMGDFFRPKKPKHDVNANVELNEPNPNKTPDVKTDLETPKTDADLKSPDKVVDRGVEGTGKATLGEIRQATEFLKNNGLNATQRREVIEAFNPGAQVVKLQDDLVVYRYSGGAANPRGRWVTTEQLSDPVNQLALPPGSTAENVTKWVIPKGTEVFKGTVAPNFGKQGGASQIYLPDPSVLK